MTRPIQCHYDVFSKGELEMLDLEIDGLRAQTVQFSREERPADFRPPQYALDPQGGRFRMPVTDGVGIEVMSQLMQQMTHGTSVLMEKEWDDLSPFQLTLGLVGALAQRGGALVIDRTTGIGYTADEIIQMADDLNEDGIHSVRDAVVLEETVTGDVLLLRSRGMCKYGQRDFAVAGFPAEHPDAGRRYVLDNLCQYAGLNATILPDQNMQYRREDPEAKIFFSEDSDGVLNVTDCHPTEKKPVPGIAKLLSIFMPAYHAASAQEEEDGEDENDWDDGEDENDEDDWDDEDGEDEDDWDEEEEDGEDGEDKDDDR